MTTKFYKCEMCGNVVVKLVDSKVPVVCCGKPMVELKPNTVDASNEKHVPVVTRLDNNTIKVDLKDKPEAVIALGDAKAVAVYEYCNLHGLWKTEL